MLKPSKELLSAVLGIKVIDDDYVYYEDYIAYKTPIDGTTYYWESINIYTFGNKCKQWAWDKHKQIVSSLIDERTARTPNEETLWYASCTSYYAASLDGIYEKTEPDAIAKICQWVLENKGKINDT